MANKRHADITNIVYIMFHSYQYTSGTSNDVYSIITTQKNSYADWKTFLVLPEKTFFFSVQEIHISVQTFLYFVSIHTAT